MDDNRNIHRVGVVSAVDLEHLRVRVYYPQMDKLVSDWLPVIQQPYYIATEDNGAHENAGETESAGSHNHDGEVSSGGSHKHPLQIAPTEAHAHNVRIYGWTPAVNDRVLVLYIQGFSQDGFVLGVIP